MDEWKGLVKTKHTFAETFKIERVFYDEATQFFIFFPHLFELLSSSYSVFRYVINLQYKTFLFETQSVFCSKFVFLECC